MAGVEVILADHPINPASKANAMSTTNSVFRNDSNINSPSFLLPHIDENLYC